MSLCIAGKHRFDDNDCSPEGYCYSGFDILIKDALREYLVRLYDDEPGNAKVIAPLNIARLPEARQLVDFVTAELGCKMIELYCEDAGYMKPVDISTLEFICEGPLTAERKETQP